MAWSGELRVVEPIEVGRANKGNRSFPKGQEEAFSKAWSMRGHSS